MMRCHYGVGWHLYTVKSWSRTEADDVNEYGTDNAVDVLQLMDGVAQRMNNRRKRLIDIHVILESGRILSEKKYI